MSASDAVKKIASKLFANKAEKLPSMEAREAAVLNQKWNDIVAQEKVAKAKEARSVEKWSKLSDEDRTKKIAENLKQKISQRASPSAPTGNVSEGGLDWNELAQEQGQRQKLNKTLETKKNQELQDAAERAKKTAQNKPIGDDTAITQAFNAPGTLKNKALSAIAQKLRGEKTNAPDEDLAFEAVDAVAEKLGIPASNKAGQVGKAAIATAIETLTPQNLIDVLPVGKVLSKGGKVVKASGVLGQGKKIASEGIDAIARKIRSNTAMDVFRKKLGPSLAEQLEKQGAKRVVPKGKIVGGS